MRHQLLGRRGAWCNICTGPSSKLEQPSRRGSTTSSAGSFIEQIQGTEAFCQNPLLAFSFLKILAPDRDPNVCAAEGSMYSSHRASSYRLVRSQQICTEPVFVGMGTNAEAPACWFSNSGDDAHVLSSSSFTAANRATGTRLGVARQKGDGIWARPDRVRPLLHTSTLAEFRISPF